MLDGADKCVDKAAVCAAEREREAASGKTVMNNQ